ETGMIHALKKKAPDARFIAASDRAICPNMKRTTLEKILWSLEEMQYIVEVPAETRAKANKALERMVEVLPRK
ncbi:MAG: quinolinate synthase NadA, partial [Sedimentisphaerales bacterium]|nr:quinolinate synthase NadA [Sedimentisphaerales bacterium]